ncbi:major facilitator family transporter [Pectobacterium atrosepticum SCRI1043]|uniref:Major facilitator family transporter n=1 Tax=Pectobacterium atrosepticum (strain SCRI 1043 / ATCC BAA-672) TaxID=218491 RepID=Q6D5H0_PECAS|nr:MFS transporter [Pectobacterium atrosepticum]AIK14325.1 major facilitator family transporter [Pectobacterium atrosepticum]POW29244.1 MFS transporter [Pectobacterium atrosepticum]GKV83833.1 MFS transporter [Pectobacterium carotovorum subsp. carotovorum]CAG74972.1 major facilitator family transporter [Pectobacterium atrosepticum SCRI1043]
MARTQDMLKKQRVRLLEIALALGGFALGATEFASMGLLPDIARSSGITETRAAGVISAYALGAIVGAPLLTLLGAKLSRRSLLLLTMTLVIIGNFATVFSTSFSSLFFARFLSGIPHGAYFGVAGFVVASSVPLHQRARAISRFMLGVTLSIVVGTPSATFIGQVFGWRWAFVMVCILAMLTLIMIALFLPPNPNEKRSAPQIELQAMMNIQVWLTLGIAAVGFAGMFCVYSYLAPALTNITKLSPHGVPLMLVLFGIGTVVGNVIGGRLCDRFGFDSVGIILAGSAVCMFIYPSAMHGTLYAAISILLVGCLMALAPALQIRLLEVASSAPSLAAASNHAAFNIANAVGPWLGGIAISAGYGWTSTGYIGAAMAIGGLGIWYISRRLGT